LTVAERHALPGRELELPTRITVQIEPETMKFLNFFHSAVNPKPKRRGFCLVAAGAAKDANHWVRFDDFRVVR
jgi:hypothetical protein